jgi:hypothetical protein
MKIPTPITDCDQLPTEHWRNLCNEDAGYRAAWFDGTGPGQERTDKTKPERNESGAQDNTAQRERRERRITVCRECPAGLWNGNMPKPGCPVGSFMGCSFTRKLGAAERLCKHWPE